MADRLYVAVKNYRKGDEAECVGAWRDREQAVTDIEAEHRPISEFSDATEGYWGTEDWTIILTQEQIRE